MNRISFLMLLAVTISAGQSARATQTDYNHAYVLDGCDQLPTRNVPRFSVCWVKAVYHDAEKPTEIWHKEYEAIITPKKPIVITNYSDFYDGMQHEITTCANDCTGLTSLFFDCGSYGPDTGSSSLAGILNAYITAGTVPTNTTISESHNGSSFSVSVVFDDGGKQIRREVSYEYDGAVLPRRGLNHGRDKHCHTNKCSSCSVSNQKARTAADPGMPVWSISEPYLNLWVHDTPAFYRTSLGQEISFQVNYKQRDTRPKDDELFPTTGWNHNWYSYVHFDIPVKAWRTNNAVGKVLNTSARGIVLRDNWIFTNDFTKWEAILYAPDNSESYLTGQSNTDPQNSYTLVPTYAGGTVVAFRLVHGDGSQDVYDLLVGPQQTYGITRRYGCVYDKLTWTNGMKGVWRLPVGGTGTPQQSWQDEDDAANYTSDTVSDLSASIQLADIYDDALAPSDPVYFLAYDALLTKRIDPYGNAITLSYTNANGKAYLASIVDYDNKITYLGYDGSNKLHTVTMPYGRSASFVYDNSSNLVSVTDAQGMTSTMTYISADNGLNQRLHTLTTPYGPTTFTYQDEDPYISVPRPSYMQYDSGEGHAVVFNDAATMLVYVGEYNVNHSIGVTHPNGSLELYLYYGNTNASPLTRTWAVSSAITNTGGSLLDYGQAEDEEGGLLGRNFFHWSRAQTPLLSMSATNLVLTNFTAHDFLIGTMSHYPVEIWDAYSADMDISPFPSLIREASPDGVHSGNTNWFTYPGAQSGSWQMDGEGLDSTQITQAPDGTPLVTSLSYDGSSGLLSTFSETYTRPDDGTADTRSYTFQYTQIPIDEGDGIIWNLTALKSVSGPLFPIITLNEPEATTVGGYTVLSWPMVQSTNGENNVSTFYYNARHQYTGARLANGLTITNLYDSYGFLQSSSALEASATTSFSFTDGELATLTTPLGLALSYSHDYLGRLTEIGFPDGSTIQNTYDRLDLIARKDRLGNWSYADYDTYGQLYRLRSPNNGQTTLSYCLCGALESITDPGGAATTYQRNNVGQATNIVSAAGTITNYFDNLGRLFHLTSTYGLNLYYGYNFQGLRTGVTNLAGTAFSMVYDAADRPKYVTDGAGVSITNDFDNLSRLRNRWNAFGLIEENVYSEQGISRHYDALRNITSYGYDAAGRLYAVTNANQEVTQVGFDPIGDILSLTDGRNHTKRWKYNIYGRQIAETNANNVLVRTNGYDANGRLTKQWTAAKGLASFIYDAEGNLRTSSYPHGTMSYTYDALDRLTSMTDGLGTTTFGYANFAAFKSALASEDGPWSSDTVSYSYSGPLLASVTLGSWSKSISRDSSLRPYFLTSPAGNFTYSFSGAGRRVSTLAVPGSTTTFTYDTAGEPTTIQVTHSATSLDYHSYDYDLNGFITNVTRLNGVHAAYGYDGIGQLLTAQGFESGGALRKNENLGYAYDASGNLQFRTNNAFLQTFTSDFVNQLSSVVRTGALTVAGSVTGAVATLNVNGTNAELYADATFATASGLTFHNGNNMFVTAGSNVVGELVLSTVTTSRLPVSVTFSYDANGNLLSDGLKAYAYDDLNQLTNVAVLGVGKTEFVYDGLGRRRITREYSYLPSLNSYLLTNEIRYVCDGMLPIQERDSNNTAQVTYTRGLDLSGGFQGAGGIGGLLARSDGSAHSFYHADIGGNITSLTDSSGNALAQYLYDPFGNLLGKWGALADANVIRFSSMPYYRNADIFGYWGRFYAPNLQRWLNQDPVGEAGGINLYRFVGNNPVSRLDPFGLSEPKPNDPISQPIGEAIQALIALGKGLWHLTDPPPSPGDPHELFSPLNLGTFPEGPIVIDLSEPRGVGNDLAAFAVLFPQLRLFGKVPCPPKGLRLIGRVTVPPNLRFGTTTFGRSMEKSIADLLKTEHPEVPFVFKIGPGQRGVDIEVPLAFVDEVGFRFGEIKPLTESGEAKFYNQIFRWGFQPAQVLPITYDANGNVFTGFK